MNKIKINKVLFFVFGIIMFAKTSNSYAQQDPQYTQYMYNMSVVNPAYAGSKDATSLGLLYRKQWINIEGAPATFTFFGHTPLQKNVGAGISLINDRIGPVNETNVFADISYTVNLSDTHKLAFGIKTGATFHKIDYSIIYPTLVQDDDLFNQPNPNTTDLNFGAGLFYYTDNYYFSAAIPNFLKSNYLDYNGISYGSEVPHFFIMGGYVFQLNPNLKFKPSFMTKSSVSDLVSIDVSANFLINEKLELGATYRREDSFGLMANFKINQNLRIGYAYDHIVSNLNFATPSSHEIIILFDLFSYNKVSQSSRFF